MTDESSLLAAQRVALLQSASKLQQMGPGWEEIRILEQAWLRRAEHDALTVKTDDPAKALDALRRWQIAHELIETRDGYIADTINRAKELSQSMTLDDALLMEQHRHEQSNTSGDPGATDRTGY